MLRFGLANLIRWNWLPGNLDQCDLSSLRSLCRSQSKCHRNGKFADSSGKPKCQNFEVQWQFWPGALWNELQRILIPFLKYEPPCKYKRAEMWQLTGFKHTHDCKEQQTSPFCFFTEFCINLFIWRILRHAWWITCIRLRIEILIERRLRTLAHVLEDENKRLHVSDTICL